MSTYKDDTKDFLEERYSRREDGKYYGHQPIYGIGGFSEPSHLVRLSLTLNILSMLNRITFISCLDVGGGEGYLSNLIRNLFGAEVHNCELSLEACRRSEEIYGIRSTCCDASVLPFEENSFDIVVCSEVIEHVVDPVLVLQELKRVARKYLLVSTHRFCENEQERYAFMQATPAWLPHADRSCFTLTDFSDLLGPDIEFTRQFTDALYQIPDDEKDLQKVRMALKDSLDRVGRGEGNGIIILKKCETQTPPEETQNRYNAEELIESVLTERKGDTGKSPAILLQNNANRFRGLMCVECAAPVNVAGDKLQCAACGSSFEIRDGIPIMLPISGKRAEETRKELRRFYEHYDHIFSRMGFLDRNKRFDISSMSSAWKTSTDGSGNAYYSFGGHQASLVLRSEHGSTHIRLTLKSNLKNTSIPIMIKADELVALATVYVTSTWQTYYVPLPFARMDIKISFTIGVNMDQFSSYMQTAGGAGLQIKLYSLETVNLIPQTFPGAYFKWQLPVEHQLDALKHRISKLETELSEVNRLFPIRLYRRIRGLK